MTRRLAIADGKGVPSPSVDIATADQSPMALATTRAVRPTGPANDGNGSATAQRCSKAATESRKRRGHNERWNVEGRDRDRIKMTQSRLAHPGRGENDNPPGGTSDRLHAEVSSPPSIQASHLFNPQHQEHPSACAVLLCRNHGALSLPKHLPLTPNRRRSRRPVTDRWQPQSEGEAPAPVGQCRVPCKTIGKIPP
jgi:hypothetical protein